MAAQADAQSLVTSLRKAVGLLDGQQQADLRQQVITLCDRITHPVVRVAVFGPFNYGKSTLLNALLGEKALPIDLIPTTGAAIAVNYGGDLSTRITLTDGTVVAEPGTDILKRYAVLDDARQMRDDVAAVEVYCPHPWLKTGVELLDLPGTDDQEAQSDLVHRQLLTADLVVQMLDARKLMTLGEREHLRDWLLDRGITTVIFVVNFLNLMEPADQKQVLYRLRFLAESFRANLPDGVSNLYRVDALPALRARLKGDMAAAQVAGLPTLESALQTIVENQRSQLSTARLPRLAAIVPPVQQALRQQIQAITTGQATHAQDRAAQKAAIQQKARTLIQQGLDNSIANLRDWLSLPYLLSQYGSELATSLQQFEFSTWKTLVFEPAWSEKRRAVIGWVYRACDFFDCSRPPDLWVALPEEPTVTMPGNPPSQTSQVSGRDVAPVAIATGLGWVLGGPLGATILGGTSYLINQQGKTPETPASQGPDYFDQVARLYGIAAQNYLAQFSAEAIAALDAYEVTAHTILNQPVDAPARAAANSAAASNQLTGQLHLLHSTLDELSQAISLSADIP